MLKIGFCSKCERSSTLFQDPVVEGGLVVVAHNDQNGELCGGSNCPPSHQFVAKENVLPFRKWYAQTI